ncbi:hypothetical protein EVAR_63984_1 [Eumeta japonica]|uniref:Uncharacterized protein n=1 Tax=Eumeta variegata TaxID=151549 RepID=A0A4C1ZHX2_EUMVA|nr:hypothetical protein EVAR_63984_1 [Eumeta japonica]
MIGINERNLGRAGNPRSRRRKAWAVWATACGLAVQRASRLTTKNKFVKVSIMILMSLFVLDFDSSGLGSDLDPGSTFIQF